MTFQSPLDAIHRRLGARMINFGEWSLPLQYKGTLAEHALVRQDAAIFDVSHMGQFLVRGNSAHSWLNSLCSAQLDKLKETGTSQYTMLLNERGGVIDDLIIYKRGENDFLLCVNAANTTKDFSWFLSQKNDPKLELANLSAEFVLLALQGPKSLQYLQRFLPTADLQRLKALAHTRFSTFEFKGAKIMAARTGYTGEYGFEFYVPTAHGPAFFEACLEAGIAPAGLGARDTLRLESAYPLWGQELTEDTTPIAADLGWTLDLSKTHLTGREALLNEKAKGPASRLVALLCEDFIPRGHMKVFSGETEIGEITSGSILPTLAPKGGALAYVKAEYANLGSKVHIDVRGKKKEASQVKKPFYTGSVRKSPDLL